jgi:dTDP-4-amino-4,6-dideoxygalactose transaminase
MKKIPITLPVFGRDERRLIQKPLESGWVVQGPYVKQFEDQFCSFTGAPHAVATSSCTTALHIAVASLGLGPGDEVIVPAFTWVATANVVEYQGAKPVFCDVDPRTFNIDPQQIEARITPRTVGIIPVHLFGLCAEMKPILKVAARQHLWVVEDAACAVGAFHQGRHAGMFGDAGCFSFHPRKSITTGEGGMITTQRKGLAKSAASLRDHGASRTDLARHEGRGAFLLSNYDVLGYNYRMTDIQGALGCAQMNRLDWVLDKRRARARYYDAALSQMPWLARPVTPEGDEHGYQAYVCLFQPEPPSLKNAGRLHRLRNDLMARLEAQGISTRQGTHAPFRVGYYRKKYRLKDGEFPGAYMAELLSLALPLYPQITRRQQDCVLSALADHGRRIFLTKDPR